MVRNYFIAALAGAVVAIIALRACDGETKPEIRTVTTIDTVFETVYIPTVQGEAKAAMRYTYGGMIHDTVIERTYITTASGDTLSEFTAILDTIQNADTLHLEYNYPSSMFKYSLSRQPIEYKYFNTVTTNTVTIQPPKLSFGLQFGVGYLVSFRTGQSALGGYFGIGGNYRL
jgi:hypothetical protein